jgi:hypothetical protein
MFIINYVVVIKSVFNMLENEDIVYKGSGNYREVSVDDLEYVKTFDHPQLDHIFLLFINEVNSILSQRLNIPLKNAELKDSGNKNLKSSRLDGSLTEDELNKVVQDLAAVIREHRE